MKVAQITQLLLTLVSTIASAEAYDAPTAYGTFINDYKGVYLVFDLPKNIKFFNEVNIYHTDYHMNIQAALLFSMPGYWANAAWSSWNNDNEDLQTPWVSATNVNLSYGTFDPGNYHPYAEIEVYLPVEQPLDRYSDLNFVVSLNASEGEQSFPVNIAVTSLGTFTPSTNSSTAISSSSTDATSDLTPYGSGFYYEDKVYFNFFLPNSGFTAVGIWPTKQGKFSYVLDDVFGVYGPSNIPFDVRTGTGNYGVSMKADLEFNEEDTLASISMVGLNTTSFVEDIFEFTVLLQNLPHQIEKRFDQEFTVSITMAPVGTVPTVSAS